MQSAHDIQINVQITCASMIVIYIAVVKLSHYDVAHFTQGTMMWHSMTKDCQPLIYTFVNFYSHKVM